MGDHIKPDKSARIRLDSSVQGTGSVDPKIVQEIRDLTPAFFEALQKMEEDKKRKKAQKKRANKP